MFSPRRAYSAMVSKLIVCARHFWAAAAISSNPEDDARSPASTCNSWVSCRADTIGSTMELAVKSDSTSSRAASLPKSRGAAADGEPAPNSGCASSRALLSNSIYRRSRIATTRGSKLLPASYITFCIASPMGRARRKGRSEASASRQSTAARIRAPMGICSPFRPSGYPVPFHFSWCVCTMARTPAGKFMRDSISEPVTGWVFTFSHSSCVSVPGFSRIWSGTPSWPML